MAYPFNSNFNNNAPNNPTYLGIPIGQSKKGLPEVKLKHDSVLWDFLFLGLSIAVGILTEGLGDLVFASLLALRTAEGTYALTQGLALTIAGSVQTFFEVGGQLGVNVLAGRTSKTAIIASIMPGLGVFGLGKVFKGIRLLKNETLLVKSLVKNGVALKTANDIRQITKDLLVGDNLADNLFLNSIKNQDLDSVETVRTFREKIYRSSGIGVKKKFSNFYKSQSKRYGHTVVEDIPSLIDSRLTGQYDIRWKFKTLEQKLIKTYGKQWYKNQIGDYALHDVVTGLEDFKRSQLLKKDNLFNRTINKKRPLYKFKRVNKDKYDYAKWLNKEKFTNEKIPSLNKYRKIKNITSEKNKLTFLPKLIKEEDRLVNYTFRNLRKLTNPLRLLKPTNAIRYFDRTLAKKIEQYAIKNQWFKRLLEQINKITKHTRELDLQIIKRFNLIPAINSKWHIGFRLIGNSLFVEIFYINNASGKIVIVQRELYPAQFERMLVAYESGSAGEFYNRELALGWGLKKEWTRDILLSSASALKVQSYLYSSWYTYRNVKSFIKSISFIKQGKYSHYNWKQNIKDYGYLRLIRSSGSLLGIGWLTSGLGVNLYRGKGLGKGLSSSFARRTRTSIKRYKRKPYHNPRKRR